MSDGTSYIAYAAAYDTKEDAKADFDTLSEAGLRHITAALVHKSDNGRIHVHEKTYAGKVGGAVGAIGGAAIGVIFPPAGVAILTDAVVGGVGVGLVSHFAGGLSRHDLKQLGAVLEDGQAAVICVAEDAVATDVDKALDHAAKKSQAKLDDGDVQGALDELEKGIDTAADKAADDVS